MLIFPNGAEEVLHIRLITVADALCNGIDKSPYTIVPIIVADIYWRLGFVRMKPTILRSVICYCSYG